jgi:hypothetical protein
MLCGPMRVVEVVDVLLRADDGGQRRNVEAKQHAADRGNHGEEVDIVKLWQVDRRAAVFPHCEELSRGCSRQHGNYVQGRPARYNL